MISKEMPKITDQHTTDRRQRAEETEKKMERNTEY